MTMNPNYLNSPILPGYAYQGQFYHVNSSVQLGYWYNNAFYGSEWIEAGYDFTQTTDAYPYCYSQTGYQQLPSGSVPGYTYLQNFFKTYKDASAYQQQAYQQYQSQMMYQYYTLPPQNVPRPVEEDRINFLTIQGSPASVNPSLFTTIQSGAPRKVAAHRSKLCSLCNQEQPYFMDVFGKACCMNCLKGKYINNELYFGTGDQKLPWTPQIIHKVDTNLRKSLPQDMQHELPSGIKLPLDSAVCIGRNEAIEPGYPPSGHIVGMLSICVEEACSNPAHVLCKGCALKLLYCPICNYKILYEELPACPPECPTKHVSSFKEACPTCKKVDSRTKHQKAEEAKAEEKHT